MNTNRLRIVCWLMLLFCCGVTAFARAREDGDTPPECYRIDKTEPPFFITFERVESGEVLLRLHNNSRCALLINTNQISSHEKVVRRLEELKDGSQVPVIYHLFNLRGSKDTTDNFASDTGITRKLLPQQSVIFAVAVENFRNNADVGIQIGYLWEESGSITVAGGFGHYVLFHHSSLPQDIIR